jgi:hypothetical protein
LSEKPILLKKPKRKKFHFLGGNLKIRNMAAEVTNMPGVKPLGIEVTIPYSMGRRTGILKIMRARTYALSRQEMTASRNQGANARMVVTTGNAI